VNLSTREAISILRNFFGRELGFQFVANDRAFHLHEDRPGDVGQALLDDGPAGQALRHLKALSLDQDAPGAASCSKGRGGAQSGV
jgi:hypothetical protein